MLVPRRRPGRAPEEPRLDRIRGAVDRGGPARASARPIRGARCRRRRRGGRRGPALAVEDVLLRGEAFDAIVLSTLPPGPSRWLRLDLPHRLEGKTGLRVIHVIGHPEPAAAGSG